MTCFDVLACRKISVANLGDSKCVLARVVNGQTCAVPLSEDHKPDRPDERQRILAIGGQVRLLLRKLKAKCSLVVRPKNIKFMMEVETLTDGVRAAPAHAPYVWEAVLIICSKRLAAVVNKHP